MFSTDHLYLRRYTVVAICYTCVCVYIRSTAVQPQQFDRYRSTRRHAYMYTCGQHGYDTYVGCSHHTTHTARAKPEPGGRPSRRRRLRRGRRGAAAEAAGAGSAEKRVLAAAGNGRLPEDKARPRPRRPTVRRRKALRGRRGTNSWLISLRRMIAEQCVPGLSGADAQTGDGGRRQVESRC